MHTPGPPCLHGVGIVEVEREERMAANREANTVYAAGLVQGIVLVTFPAAGTIFTDPAQYDLSSTQYGTMSWPRSFPRSLRRCSREPWLAASVASVSPWLAC
jgi:hypothetical protein